MKYIIGFIAGIAFIFGLAWILPETEERVYDCGMAEWHPDIPAIVREECRKRRQEYIKGSKITT
jgi:hypothetical protein